MKKIFGMLALLATSGAVMVSPALANDRNDNNYRDTRAPYYSTDRDHDRVAVRDTRDVRDVRVNDRDRDRDGHDRVVVRYQRDDCR